ncbi:MAG: hypothetical protein MSA20_04570 [Bacteroidales bacterium]|nr:hypothetical protein [Bacteroidales bacterium]
MIKKIKMSNNIFGKIGTLLLLLTVCYFFSPQVAYGQDNFIFIKVKVTLMDKEGENPSGDSPVGVIIKDERLDKSYEIDDESGRSNSLAVYPNSKLTISAIGYESQTIKTGKDNNKTIEVKLLMERYTLMEAKVKGDLNDIFSGPARTVAKQEGNWYKIPFTLKLKREHFHHDSRVVVQPVLYNHTRDTVIYMRPKVLDRPEYNVTQDRLYGFDIEENDPLGEYVTVATEKDSVINVQRFKQLPDSVKGKGFKALFRQIKNIPKRLKARKIDLHTYTWVDSIYKENPNDDCDCELRCLTEDYYKVLYDTAAVVAVGVVRPLRWLEYDVGIKEITDENKIPKPVQTPKADSAKVDLQFPNNGARFDLSNEVNKRIIDDLEEKLRALLGNKNATRINITLSCTSSPEGGFAHNYSLSQERMRFATNVLYGRLGADRDRVSFDQGASVATWTDVAALLKKDSLFDKASAVEEIAAKFKNRDDQWRAMRSLPFYGDLLTNKYLPQLRRVDYIISYTEFRNPSLQETRADYEKYGPGPNINEYMYWQLYTNAENDTIRERIIREALKQYPDKEAKETRVFAHDLQVVLLRHHRSDTTLLAPFAGTYAWDEINIAHAVALLENGAYQAAMDHMRRVKETEKTRFLHSICAVLAGERGKVLDVVARTSQRNRVSVLLHIDQNEAAYKTAMQMPDSLALTHYLRAVCINRLGIAKIDDAIDKAKKELAIAIEMDPELKAIAEGDADVNKLLFDEKDELYQRKQDQYRRLLEKDRAKPRSQNYVEHEGGKQWGPKWKGHHVIVQPD